MEKDFTSQPKILAFFKQNKIIILGLIIALLGVGTGFYLSRLSSGDLLFGGKIEVAPGAQVKEKEVGLKDERTFRDKAEGILEEGGIDGEGTHHLVREGGSSQNVYLTSSVINLDEFLGKRIEVWGETHKAQKAGWLMDVGRIKIIE